MGFEVNVSIAGLVMMQRSTISNGLTRSSANARPLNPDSGMPKIEIAVPNVTKNTMQDLR